MEKKGMETKRKKGRLFSEQENAMSFYRRWIKKKKEVKSSKSRTAEKQMGKIKTTCPARRLKHAGRRSPAELEPN